MPSSGTSGLPRYPKNSDTSNSSYNRRDHGRPRESNGYKRDTDSSHDHQKFIPKYDNHNRDRYRSDDRGYRDNRYDRDRRDNRDNRYQRDHKDNRDNRDSRDNRYNNGYRNDRSDQGRRVGRERPQGSAQRSNVVPLDKIKVENSMWDKAPEGYEGYSAALAKSCGLFPIPGATAKNLDIEQVKRILNRNQKFRALSLEDSQLTPLDSRISKTLIISGVDFNVVEPEKIQKYFQNFLISTIIPGVNYEDHSVDIRLSNKPDKAILEASKSIVATTLLALNNTEIPELEVSLNIERPNEYIVFNSPASSDGDNGDEVYDDIIESSNLYTLTNIPFDTSREDVIEILSKYGTLRSLSIVMDKLTYETRGIGFFEYKSLNVSTEEMVDSVNQEELDTNRLKCFRACENKSCGYEQSIKLSAGLLLDVVNSPNHKVSKHKTTKALQFINCFTLDDLTNETKLKGLQDSFQTECETFGKIEKFFIPKPAAGFKLGVDELKPEYGRAYVKFEDKNDATACLNGLAGRYFNGRLVIAGYIDDEDFDLGIF
ncbi:hypothetical protein CANARDRAFT_26811 [[Candida] arabinofermentans NRRL YB-2248]|uniref:RRM domain-containing protein n=1 Tax=[Candida] arabinofermentans NRRL YB-2248 TaxID=983967 RepID=A0A1E4T6M4_9ASCO|nr:hypothetical protein CANARDRAFT_26811 [[Candida] arabinofermentans NRRL YB-2248]